jgi:hypothetical protein
MALRMDGSTMFLTDTMDLRTLACMGNMADGYAITVP